MILSAYYEKRQRINNEKMETWLLCFVGIIIMGFSNIVAINGDVSENAEGVFDGSEASQLVANDVLMGVFAFTLAITIIVLVMQGNKRSFYHERVSHTQSGMITFMAEVVENRDDNTSGHIRRTEQYVELIAKELKRQEIYIDILTEKYMADMVVAAYHHEWWNGKGYPYGISGTEIPLCAIIREESGTHFDPVVIEAFFAAVEDNR